jgi:hypothetical protein
MLDWESNNGDVANLIAVVDAFNTAGTIQLGYYPQWYWNQQGGGDLSDLANALFSSAYPDGTGYASAINSNAGGLAGQGWAPYGNAPAAWQFTDDANIGAVSVDCNAYLGTDRHPGAARQRTRDHARRQHHSRAEHRAVECDNRARQARNVRVADAAHLPNGAWL